MSESNPQHNGAYEPIATEDELANPERIDASGLQEFEKTLIDRITDTGVDELARKPFEGETNPDHAFGNLKEEEVRERKFTLKNELEYLRAVHPPAESALQGELREKFGLEGAKYPLEPEREHSFFEAGDASFSRASLSRSGFIVKQLLESVQELRRVEAGGDNGDDEPGALRRLLGGGK